MERNKSKAPYGTQIKNGLLDAQDYVESLALFLIMSMVSGLGCQRRNDWVGLRKVEDEDEDEKRGVKLSLFYPRTQQ